MTKFRYLLSKNNSTPSNNAFLCGICLEQKSKIVSTGCGHIICSHCFKQLKSANCWICRCLIKTKFKLIGDFHRCKNCDCYLENTESIVKTPIALQCGHLYCAICCIQNIHYYQNNILDKVECKFCNKKTFPVVIYL